MRSPRFISPYHYRLDWQFWIAASIQRLEYSPWIYSFLLKLLQQDPDTLGLLEGDPFQGENEPPRYIRIDKYRYEFYKPKEAKEINKPYWKREFVGQVFPPEGAATADVLKEMTN